MGILFCDPLKYIMDDSVLIILLCMGKYISLKGELIRYLGDIHQRGLQKCLPF